ncbi:MAG: winged helix-turn-helix domain-containing protein, partial [Acidobacteriota bacterium]
MAILSDSASRTLGERFYEFGRFRLYPFKRLLERDGTPIPVTPKVLDTLWLLAANSGRVVTKEELMSAVWAGTIVEETGLTRNISVLRKVLGTDDNGHRYIATLPGLGYQFVAEVRDVTHISTRPGQSHMVGRAKERAALQAGLQSAFAGTGMLLCVGGEPGIGKTTLIEDFLGEVAASGERCLIARACCSERLTGTGAALPWL